MLMVRTHFRLNQEHGAPLPKYLKFESKLDNEYHLKGLMAFFIPSRWCLEMSHFLESI